MSVRRTRSTRRPAAAALLLALTAVLVFGAVPAAFAKQSLGLSSAEFKFEANNGQTGKGEVFITDQGNEPIKVLIYAADQKVDPKGKVSYVVPTRDANFLDSPASWLRLDLPKAVKALGNTPYIEMKPGERLPIRFSIDVPQGAVPGDKQLVLFFEIFDFQSNSQGVTSKISGRVGARIVARVKGDLVERVDVRPFNVPQFVVGDTADYSYTIMNGGNVDQTVSAKLAVLDGNENERAKGQESKNVVFAGTNLEQTGKISLAGLAPGSYDVRLTLSYPKAGREGTPELITKDRKIWLIPVWLIVTAALLLLVALAAIVWRIAAASARRRMRREPARTEAAASTAAEQPQDRAAG